MKKNILYHRLMKDYGCIRWGCVELSKLIYKKKKKKVNPETLRAACYDKKMGFKLALLVVKVMDFTLKDLRPDIYK